MQRVGQRLACRPHLQARTPRHRDVSLDDVSGIQSLPRFCRPQPQTVVAARQTASLLGAGDGGGAVSGGHGPLALARESTPPPTPRLPVSGPAARAAGVSLPCDSPPISGSGPRANLLVLHPTPLNPSIPNYFRLLTQPRCGIAGSRRDTGIRPLYCSSSNGQTEAGQHSARRSIAAVGGTET